MSITGQRVNIYVSELLTFTKLMARGGTQELYWKGIEDGIRALQMRILEADRYDKMATENAKYLVEAKP